MLDLRYTAQFKCDIKRCTRQNLDLSLLNRVISTLRIPKALEPKYKDHPLSGNHTGKRDCHILPDWLLLYSYEDNCLVLYRTGSHSELFGT